MSRETKGLIELLKSEEKGKREKAAYNLAVIADEEAMKALFNMAEGGVRRFYGPISYLCWRLGGKEQTELGEFAQLYDWEDQLIGIRAIAETGTFEGKEYLVKLKETRIKDVPNGLEFHRRENKHQRVCEYFNAKGELKRKLRHQINDSYTNGKNGVHKILEEAVRRAEETYQRKREEGLGDSG